jgi:hypothetical protein
MKCNKRFAVLDAVNPRFVGIEQLEGLEFGREALFVEDFLDDLHHRHLLPDAMIAHLA